MLLKGKAYWARIVGQPHDNQFKPQTKQWSFDLSIDKETAQTLLEAGMRKSYLKNKADERGTYLSFARDATKTDGTAGKPFRIVDAHNNPWPADKLIGNGSTLNVVCILSEREFKKEKFLKPSALAIQVWDLVEYQGTKGGGDFPVKGSEEITEDVTNSKETW